MNDDVLLLAGIRPTATRPCRFTCSPSGSTRSRQPIAVTHASGDVNSKDRCCNFVRKNEDPLCAYFCPVICENFEFP